MTKSPKSPFPNYLVPNWQNGPKFSLSQTILNVCIKFKQVPFLEIPRRHRNSIVNTQSNYKTVNTCFGSIIWNVCILETRMWNNSSLKYISVLWYFFMKSG